MVKGLGFQKWKPSNHERLEREYGQKMQLRIEELTAISKPLHKLVVSENFIIEEILGQSHDTSVTPLSMMGGRSVTYDTGYTYDLVLKVLPEREIIHVRTLFFDGFFHGLAGHRISAKIPRYKTENVPSFRQGLIEEKARDFYLEREFNSEEKAIELCILSHDGKILKTDRAVDYSSFMKK